MTAVLTRIAAPIVLALLVLTSPARAEAPAPDPAKLAAAKELLASMNVQVQFRRTLDSMQNVLGAQVKSQPGGDKAMAVIVKIFEPDSEHVKTYLADAEAAMTAFYAERFTTDEMKEITAFQLSSSGKKLQAVLPDMVQAIGPPIGRFQESVKKIMMEELSAKPTP